MSRQYANVFASGLLLMLMLLPASAPAYQFRSGPGNVPRTRSIPLADPRGNTGARVRSAPRSVYRVNMNPGTYLGKVESLSQDRTYLNVALAPGNRKVMIKLRLRGLVDTVPKPALPAAKLVGKHIVFDVRLEEYFAHYEDAERTQVAYLEWLRKVYEQPPLSQRVAGQLAQQTRLSPHQREALAVEVATSADNLSEDEWIVIAQRKAKELERQREQLTVQKLSQGHAAFDTASWGEPYSDATVLYAGAKRDHQLATLTLSLAPDTATHAWIAFIQQGKEWDAYQKRVEFDRAFLPDKCSMLHRVVFTKGQATCRIDPGHYRVLVIPDGYERRWFDLAIPAQAAKALALKDFSPQRYIVIRKLPLSGGAPQWERESLETFVSEPMALLLAEGLPPVVGLMPDPQARCFLNADNQLQLCVAGQGDAVTDVGQQTFEAYVANDKPESRPITIHDHWGELPGPRPPGEQVHARLHSFGIEAGHLYTFGKDPATLLHVAKVTADRDEVAQFRLQTVRELQQRLVLGSTADVDRLLMAGKLAVAEPQLRAILAAHPTDQNAQFALGTTQFLLAFEHLAQRLYDHGVYNSGFIPGATGVDMHIPFNPQAKPTSYEDLRCVLEEFLTELADVEATLAKVTDNKVKLQLDLAQASFDVNRDGFWHETERWFGMPRGPGLTRPREEHFRVNFDQSDALWLRGYCHLLSATLEIFLIYDHEPLFNMVAQQFLLRPTLESGEKARPAFFFPEFAVRDKARGKVALQHLQQVITLSRATWKSIGAETDDDAEWLPGPQQKNSVVGTPITAEMVTAWHELLDQAEALLAGKLLLRFEEDRGLDIGKLLADPPAIDQEFIFRQGERSGWEPYLRKGEILENARLERATNIFGPNFPFFAFWIN